MLAIRIYYIFQCENNFLLNAIILPFALNFHYNIINFRRLLGFIKLQKCCKDFIVIIYEVIPIQIQRSYLFSVVCVIKDSYNIKRIKDLILKYIFYLHLILMKSK